MDGERNGGSKINGVMMPLCSRSKAFMTDNIFISSRLVCDVRLLAAGLHLGTI